MQRFLSLPVRYFLSLFMHQFNAYWFYPSLTSRFSTCFSAKIISCRGFMLRQLALLSPTYLSLELPQNSVIIAFRHYQSKFRWLLTLPQKYTFIRGFGSPSTLLQFRYVFCAFQYRRTFLIPFHFNFYLLRSPVLLRIRFLLHTRWRRIPCFEMRWFAHP